MLKLQHTRNLVNGEVLPFVWNTDRCLQQCHGTFYRRHGALVHVGHIGQTGQRPQQALCQENQHRIGTNGQFPVNGEPATI